MTQVSRTKDSFIVRQLLQLMALLSMYERDEFKSEMCIRSQILRFVFELGRKYS